MSAPIPEFEAGGSPDAGAFLDALNSLAPTERRKHATVFNYWHSIRGNRDFPPIRDLDPLQISDAGPHSVLLGIIDEGADADIRHIGAAIKGSVQAERISEVQAPSLLSCIAANLPAITGSKQPFAFEDVIDTDEGAIRCSVSLLPFSTTGESVDYVYGYVSLAPADGPDEAAPEAEAPPAEMEPVEAVEETEEDSELLLQEVAPTAEDEPAIEPEPEEPSNPGFSGRLSEKLKAAAGFYGRVADLELGAWKVEDPSDDPSSEEPLADEPEQVPEQVVTEEPEQADPEPETIAQELEQAPQEPEEIIEEPEHAIEQAPPAESQSDGGLQSLLAAVRSKADEARLAKLRSNVALYEGLGAAYDFALDAEHEPEDYLKLVEAKGLKIQLRAPMAPVVKLAFSGMCDDSTIAQLEAVLAWAIKQDLPRGSLAERIQSEGGIAAIIDSIGKKA
ncbi:MAG TPA: hypothetical protein VHN55_00835 [Sphingomicrobium sp.]|nr:hypothetical protein [Sphingomicrobium sp.]